MHIVIVPYGAVEQQQVRRADPVDQPVRDGGAARNVDGPPARRFEHQAHRLLAHLFEVERVPFEKQRHLARHRKGCDGEPRHGGKRDIKRNLVLRHQRRVQHAKDRIALQDVEARSGGVDVKRRLLPQGQKPRDMVDVPIGQHDGRDG